MKKGFAVAILALLTTSCGHRTPSSYDPSQHDSQTTIKLTGQIVTCNKCMGYGMVQDGLHGQPHTCRFCEMSTLMRIQAGWMGFDGRYGLVDAVFNSLPPDFFDELDMNGNDEYDSNQYSDQIEAEIARHEENIAQIEQQLEYIESDIYRTILEQQLIEEQYEIKRLTRQKTGMGSVNR